MIDKVRSSLLKQRGRVFSVFDLVESHVTQIVCL